MNFFVCDVGGTNLRIAVVDDNGNILFKQCFRTPTSYDEFIKLINCEYRMLQPQFRISACSFSVAGSVAQDGSIWLPNVFNSYRYSLKMDLKEQLGDVAVVIVDDRTSGVLGECWKGSAVGFKDVAYLIVGTGVGLGVLVNGQIIRGAKNALGSVGWITVQHPLTGEIVRIEDVISGPAIVKQYKKLTNQEVMSAEDVIEMYRGHRDEYSVLVVRSVSTVLGYLISIVLSCFDPQILILAGGVGQNWEIFRTMALESLQKNLSPLQKEINIVPSKLGEDAQLIGCVRYLKLLLKEEKRS